MCSSNRRSPALREAWRVFDRRPVILCTGVLTTRELALLARCRRILDDHRRPHRFVVCGPGGHRDGWQEALPDAVFIDDRGRPDLATIFASSDLFLSASERLSADAGTAMLMAQASGVPVLVPNLIGHDEDMIHGVTGFLCQPRSEHDLAWRTAELLANVPRRSAMAASATAYARTRPWTSALEPLFQSYRDVAQAAASASVLNAIGVRTA